MVSVCVSVLGPVLVRVDGAVVRVGGPLPRTILAVLVAAGGRAVPAETIIEQVWGDGPPAQAASTLYGYIARLRRLLEPERTARSTAHRLVREGTGYALRADLTDIDAVRFEALAAEGHSRLARADLQAAATALTTALALWRGDPYADVHEAPLLMAHGARLERVRATAVADRYDTAIAMGEHAGTIAPLEALVEDSPFDERLWELLALAQHRAGRHGDALATLRTARRRLVDELGIDPGERLRTLESELHGRTPARDSLPRGVTRTEWPASGRLPAALDVLVGRRTELPLVTELLRRHRLVTLVGPAGVGKTRLALEVARSAPRSRSAPALVELADARGAGPVTATVARSLGLTGVVDVGQLVHALHNSTTLLVVDNCEHLVDEVAEVVTALLQHCPGVRFLTTSRQSLRVPGEAVFEVAPLALPDAVALFLERARTTRAGWSPEPGEQRLVEQVCTALDGLPLAVEIAAARSRVLPLDRLKAGLNDCLQVLTGGQRGGPVRHRSLEAALEWGYSLLEPAEQRLLCTVSVFAGGFTLDAVQEVCDGTGRRPVDTARIGDLVDRSLIARGPADRYRLLEPVRQFARDRQAPDERHAAQRAHRQWVVGLVEHAGRMAVSEGVALWAARLGPERDNIRTALATAQRAEDWTTGLRIATALVWWWCRWGAVEEGRTWLHTFLDAAERSPVEDEVLARGRFTLAALCSFAGDLPATRTFMVEARDIAARADDRVTEARSTVYAAQAAALHGAASADTLQEVERGVALADATGLDWVRAEAMTAYGVVSAVVDGGAAATARLEAGWRAAIRCGHEWVTYSAVRAHVRAECGQGRPAAAVELGSATLARLLHSADRTSWLMLAHTTAGALAGLSADDGPPGRDPAVDAAVVLGAVDALAAEYHFDLLRWDPVDGPTVRSAVASRLHATQLAEGLARGRRHRRSDLVELLAPYQS